VESADLCLEAVAKMPRILLNNRNGFLERKIKIISTKKKKHDCMKNLVYEFCAEMYDNKQLKRNLFILEPETFIYKN
jgi:hypothetical protein